MNWMQQFRQRIEQERQSEPTLQSEPTPTPKAVSTDWQEVSGWMQRFAVTAVMLSRHTQSNRVITHNMRRIGCVTCVMYAIQMRMCGGGRRSEHTESRTNGIDDLLIANWTTKWRVSYAVY